MKNVLMALVAIFAIFAFASPALAISQVCLDGSCTYDYIGDAMGDASEGSIITVNGEYTFDEYVTWTNDGITLDCNNSLINASSF